MEEQNGTTPKQSEVTSPLTVDLRQLESKLGELVEVLHDEQEEKKKDAEKTAKEDAEAKKKANEQAKLEEQAEEQAKLEVQVKDEADIKFREDVLKALDAEQPETISYSEQLNLVVEKLDAIQEEQQKVSDLEHISGIYLYVVIPTIIIIYGLWKMIKPFIP